jgi:hypothetical protein
VARQLCETKQRPRLLQSAPAIHQNERGQNSEPHGLHSQREDDEPSHTEETDDRGRHQTASAAHYKPKQGPKNLAAIERINREHIEDQQAQVNQRDGSQQQEDVWHLLRQSERPHCAAQDHEDRNENHIY